MITVCWPVERSKVWLSNTWAQHIARPGYNRAYAGVDLAGPEQPLRSSQFNGRILQAMWSTQGYGYTVFVEYGEVLRTRTAHQKNLGVNIGQIVQPSDWNLGKLGTTGNSTGNHTHWEVWLKYDANWQNIDPLDPQFGVNIVDDPAYLVPLDGSTPPTPQPGVKLPTDLTFQKVKCSSVVDKHKWVNVRSLPSVRGADLGDIKPGEIWDVFGYKIDVLGNIWFAVKKNDVIGWAAAQFAGEVWLETL
jgi:murein DD-endopeptidase MepM/ murein hydrolase activator NlpD